MASENERQRRIAVYGAGGFGREVAWLIEETRETDPSLELVGFIDDTPGLEGKCINELPVHSLEDASALYPGLCFVPGIGEPEGREAAVSRAIKRGLALTTIIHPQTTMSRFVSIGAGTVICAGSILTVNIKLGICVQVNLDCTVGHDAVLEDYATLAPGVHVSGRVLIGRGAYIGTGASIINGTSNKPLVIGRGAVVGAGACVVRDVPDGQTVVGVPARHK